MNPIFPLPSYVKTALAVCERHAHEAYLVGGCVRDLLRGVTPADYDIAVSCPPEETERAFAGYRVIETGMKHGTVTVVIEGQNLELTTFRVDGSYADGRHPDRVTFTPALSADLARRDFTVNAMAYHPAKGLVDLFGGQDDLQRGIIRCVGDPDARFTEDALRILRALRFASVLDFDVEAGTAAAVLRHKSRLAAVSAERKFTELKKLLAGRRVEALLTEFRPVFTEVLPELDALSPEDYAAAAAAAGALADPLLSFAALFRNLPCEAPDAACRRLKTDNAFRKNACFLREHLETPFVTPGRTRIFMGQYGREALSRLLRLREVLSDEDLSLPRRVLTETEAYPTTLGALAVNGTDLASIGVRGPALGQTLALLLNAAAEGEVQNDRASLLQWAKDRAVETE